MRWGSICSVTTSRRARELKCWRNRKPPEQAAVIIGKPDRAGAEPDCVAATAAQMMHGVRRGIDARQRYADNRRPNRTRAVGDLAAAARYFRRHARDQTFRVRIHFANGAVALVERPNQTVAGGEKTRL